MAGFIYIMSNPAFPDRIKIGKSTKDPTRFRRKELFQTGVPEPFKVEYYAFVEDEDHLEYRVHDYFKDRCPNRRREFFEVDCAEAISTIRRLSELNSRIKYEEVFFLTQEQIEKARLEREEKLETEKQERKAKAKRVKEERARIEAETVTINEKEKSASDKKVESKPRDFITKLIVGLMVFTLFGYIVGWFSDGVTFFILAVLGISLVVSRTQKEDE